MRFQLAAHHEGQWILLRDQESDDLDTAVLAAAALCDAPALEGGVMVVDHERKDWAAHVRFDEQNDTARVLPNEGYHPRAVAVPMYTVADLDSDGWVTYRPVREIHPDSE